MVNREAEDRWTIGAALGVACILASLVCIPASLAAFILVRSYDLGMLLLIAPYVLFPTGVVVVNANGGKL